MALPTNLTVAQLTDARDNLILLMATGVKTVHFADGRYQENQSGGDIRTALSAVEEILRQMTGQTGDRVALAQHKRGEGPSGPGRLFDAW